MHRGSRIFQLRRRNFIVICIARTTASLKRGRWRGLLFMSLLRLVMRPCEGVIIGVDSDQ